LTIRRPTSQMQFSLSILWTSFVRAFVTTTTRMTSKKSSSSSSGETSGATTASRRKADSVFHLKWSFSTKLWVRQLRNFVEQFQEWNQSSGVNFTNIVWADFRHLDPKIKKKTVKLLVLFHFWDLCAQKLLIVCWWNSQIDLRCQCHQHFMISFFYINVFAAFMCFQFEFVIFLSEVISVKGEHKGVGETDI